MDRVLAGRVVSAASDRPDAPDEKLTPWRGGDLKVEEFLTGALRAEGIFQDFTGRVRRRFAVAMQGRRDGASLVLQEDFTFDDGAKEERLWLIEPLGEGRYRAHADDMMGEARGAVKGGALMWSYGFWLRVGKKRLPVRFHDTFVQLSETCLLNTARITLLGLPIGRTTLHIEKR